MATSRGQPTLTTSTVAMIKGMVKRGDRQIDIALYHCVSPATVNAIKKGRVVAYRDVPVASPAELPAPGPYVVVAKREHDAAMSAQMANALLVSELETLIQKYRDKQ